MDLRILNFFNHNLANPVCDWLSDRLFDSNLGIILLLGLIAILIWKSNVRLRLAVILAVMAVLITDPTTHYILKTLFGRIRPCHALAGLRLIAGCGGLYGMPSNHAVNSFAAAGILTYFYRRAWYLFLTIAGIIGLSRVYLGKHYPSDIAAGALFGIGFAALVIILAAALLKKMSANGRCRACAEIISGSWKWKIRKSGEN